MRQQKGQRNSVASFLLQSNSSFVNKCNIALTFKLNNDMMYVKGYPFSELAVQKLAVAGYSTSDVVDVLIVTKFGEKMCRLKDGKTITV